MTAKSLIQSNQTLRKLSMKKLLFLFIKLLLGVVIVVFTVCVALYIISEIRYNAKNDKILPIIKSKGYFFCLLGFKRDGEEKREIDDSLIHYSPYLKKIFTKDNVNVYACPIDTKRLSYETVLIIKYKENKIEDFYCFLVDYRQKEFYFIPTFDPDGKPASIITENSIWSSPVREKLFIDKMLELIKDKKVETLYSAGDHYMSPFKNL